MKPFNVFPYDSNIDFMRMRWVSVSVAVLLMVGRDRRDGHQGLQLRAGLHRRHRRRAALRQGAGRRRRARAAWTPPASTARRCRPSAAATTCWSACSAEGTQRRRRRPRQQHRRRGRQGGVAADGNPASEAQQFGISPQVGKELALNGMYAVLFVIIGFLVYISLRFEWKFAIAAIIATMHDVLVVRRLVRDQRARVRPDRAGRRAVGDGLLDQRHHRGVRPRARELPQPARRRRSRSSTRRSTRPCRAP